MNWFITSILLIIPACFGPIISIVWLIGRESDIFPKTIYYQLTLIIPCTIIQIIILCINQIFIIKVLCMISFFIGITYINFVVLLFCIFITNNGEYVTTRSSVIITEYMLIINMILITFMNVCDFDHNAFILSLILFINIFFPNLPFCKTYIYWIYM